MKDWTAKEFVTYIDNKFFAAKKDNVSRMDVGWGKWSREMNLVLRERIESKVDTEELALKNVFFYWILISQILEFYFKNKIINAGRIKKRTKEAKKIKEMIMSGEDLKDFDLNKEIFSQIENVYPQK